MIATANGTIDAAPAAAITAIGWAGHALRRAWPLADQALVASVNVVTTVLLARGMSPAAFGSYTLVYAVLLCANGLQSALITQPHNVLGIGRLGVDYRRYTATTAVSQLAVSAAAALVVLAAGSIATLVGWQHATLLVVLAPAIVAAQLQEFARRVLYTEGRHAAVFTNDVITYGGQGLLVAALWRLGALTPAVALGAMCAASAAGAAYGLLQLRASLQRTFDWRAVRDNWEFGKWLAGGEVLRWLSSAEMYQYLAAALLGSVAAATMKAAQVFFGPARLLIYAVNNVLPTHFARALAESEAAFDSAVRRVLCWMAVPIGAYCGVVALWSAPLLRLVYGERYADAASVLSLYALSAFLGYEAMLMGAALQARRRTRSFFVAYIYTSVVSLTVGWLLIRAFGVAGALIGMILTSIISNVVFWRAYRRREATLATGGGAQLAALPQVELPAATSSMVPAPAAAAGDGTTSREVLRNVFAVLDEAGIPCCVLHGYDRIVDGKPLTGDVDCAIPAGAARQRIVALLRAKADRIGAAVVDVSGDTNLFVRFVAWGPRDTPCVIHLDLLPGFRYAGRLLYPAEELLATRRWERGIPVPAPDVEFGCYLARKIAKGTLSADSAARLSAVYARDPAGCRRQVARFWGASDARLLVSASESANWSAVLPRRRALRGALLRRFLVRQPRSAWRGALGAVHRRLRLRPAPSPGVHVVLLGPDGVGKSTLIDAVSKELAALFGTVLCPGPAPAVLPWSGRGRREGRPHALRERPAHQSILKALYWLAYYRLTHLMVVRPALRAGALVVFHRSLVDALVDARRYRYGGPRWLLEAVVRRLPAPDLVIVLDAPAEVVQSRKQEVPFEETARQRGAYRALAARLANGYVLDAAQPSPDVCRSMMRLVVSHMSERTGRRLDAGA